MRKPRPFQIKGGAHYIKGDHMDLPNRKTMRLKEYDYSTPGAYFVTICTKDKQKILGDVVGEGLCALPKVILTDIGTKIDAAIRYINTAYETVSVDKYVVMPNHIHMLVCITDTGGRGGPPLQHVIGRMKSYTTHQHGVVLWQKSFYDHIIRDKHDYDAIWRYIDENPAKWNEDEFFIP